MANDSGEKNKRKPRIRKAPVSFREAAEQEQTKQTAKMGKPSRKRRAARGILAPFKFIGRPLGKALKVIFRPFRFVLRPFKTRPMRFVGRLLGRIFWPRWLRNSIREVRQVVWPGRRETWKLTFAVFMFAIIFGTMVALVDYGLDKVFKRLILK